MSDMDNTESQLAPEPQGAPSAVRPKRASMLDDPVVRSLVLFSFAIVIVFIVTVLAALMMGEFSPKEPRTRAERDLAIYEQQAMTSPRDTTVWRNYINALIDNKQYSKAQTIIDRVKKNEAMFAYVKDFKAEKPCRTLLSQADSYAQTGRMAKAKELYREVINKYGDTIWSQEAAQKLSQMP